MNILVRGKSLFLISTAGLMIGCMEKASPVQEDSASEGRTESINNSDPGKPGYIPTARVEKQAPPLQEILDYTPGYKGVKDYAERQPAAPLAKTASTERWVGVLPKFQSGYNACPEANSVRIRMDDEDSDNESHTSGSIPFGALDNDGSNTTLFFCKVPGNTLHPLSDGWWHNYDYASQEYAVLKLDDQCPEGSQTIGLHEDNEDSRNNNSNSGNIWPTTQTGSSGATIWQFCYFRAVCNQCYGRLPSLPYVGTDYAVFTMYNTSDFSNFRNYSYVYADDEDDSNDNAYIWNSAGSGEQMRFQRIIQSRRSGSWSGTHFILGTIQP